MNAILRDHIIDFVTITVVAVVLIFVGGYIGSHLSQFCTTMR
jgi:hypothetical protein